MILVAVGTALLAAAPCRLPLCTCKPMPESEHLALAAAVFAGRVLSVVPGDREDIRVATLVVERRDKGRVADTVRVHTGLDNGSCGFPFEAGRRYLVYAGRSDGLLWTGRCWGTRTIAN